MKEAYEDKRFHVKSLEMVRTCDEIITSFAKRGFKLTIRQLYYQLVAQGIIENSKKSYNNTVVLLTNARLAGLIDWDSIEDRTREVIERSHWTSVQSILQGATDSYHEDMWREQPCLIVCIVEKEALAGIFHSITRPWDIPLLPARGYPSATALRDLAKDRIMHAHQDVVVLHFGDHDPSGIDMSRDLEERLTLFSRQRVHIDFRRLALNMDQVEDQKPPPNPAKDTDCRFNGYYEKFGDESWELDALSPEYLAELVKNEVESLYDKKQWLKTRRRIETRRAALQEITDNYKDPE